MVTYDDDDDDDDDDDVVVVGTDVFRNSFVMFVFGEAASYVC